MLRQLAAAFASFALLFSIAACATFSISCRSQSTSQPTPSMEQTPPSKTNSERFAITGILRSKDGSPVMRKTVYFFLVQNGVAYAKLGMQDEKISVVNPRGESDDEGHFAIDVDPALIKEWQAITKDFTIGFLDEKSQPLPLKREGVQIIFRFDETNRGNKLDLGPVTVERNND